MINELNFNAQGLIPAIIQDRRTGEVLTLAYMNRESLEISIKRKLVCFYSRSREQLWLKGETSGNYQHIDSITCDCDKDALLIKVLPDGPACHTGEASCFHNALIPPEKPGEFTLDKLYELLLSRKRELPEGSYTTYLFKKGLDKILKKVGEESTEVIIASKNDAAEAAYEIADLAYHVLVLMAHMGITPEDIRTELASRHVVDKKVKQEKMT